MAVPPIPDQVTRTAPAPLRRALFWHLQLVVWPLLGIMYFLAVLPSSTALALGLLAFKLIWAASGLAVSTLLALVYQRLLQPRLHWQTVLAAIGLSVVWAILWVWGMGRLAFIVSGSTTMLYTPTSFPFVALNHVFVLLAWSGAFLALVYWHRSQVAERQSLATQSLLREARLAMLQYQVNPHFLFNTLTSVRALIRTEPDQAWTMVTRLSEFLRYTLTPDQHERVTIAEEVRILQEYLAIEQVRFGERLAVEVELDPAIATAKVPIFLLHPLVENAIKHGSPASDGIHRLSLKAYGHEGCIGVDVANTGRLTGDASSASSEQIGLRNVQERLATAFPRHHHFELIQEDEWVHARLHWCEEGGTP